MRLHGDFLVPHLNGAPYSDKPPLLFWLITSLGTSESRGVQLAKRNRDAALLRVFGENLQSCLSLKEGYEVIAKHMPELLPGKAGAMFLLDASRSRSEAAVMWSLPEGLQEVFSPNDCQAVRRGHLYHVADSAKQPNCRRENRSEAQLFGP